MKHKKYFFCQRTIAKMAVSGFMISYLPAEIFAGVATISVRVADVLKHTAVNLELIDTRDLANVKKIELRLAILNIGESC